MLKENRCAEVVGYMKLAGKNDGGKGELRGCVFYLKIIFIPYLFFINFKDIFVQNSAYFIK